ncbi:hypothetical protein [Adhaeribacter swui]|nr:hypothetical protein [Adhaeribacter swui]
MAIILGTVLKEDVGFGLVLPACIIARQITGATPFSGAAHA